MARKPADRCGQEHLDYRGHPGCTAHSSQKHRPCRQPRIAGGSVCRSHGGSAPQVRASAQARLRALLHPALDRLEKLLDDRSGHVAMRAIELIVEKAGTESDTEGRHALTQLVEELQRAADRAEPQAAGGDPPL